MERTKLNTIQVASPCNVSWGAMAGDDQVRFCGQCEKHVYNLSAMSLDEISHLLEKKEGRACVRFYRRADGTVLTDDCPVGLRAVRRRMALLATAAAGALATLGFAMFHSRGSMARTLRNSSLGKIEIVRQLADWMEPRAQIDESAVMGRMVMPTCARRDPVPLMGDVYVPPRKPASPPRTK